MISSLQNIIATFLIVGFILGRVANGFIALVNCIDWVKKRKFSSVDAILTALAVSRIGLLWAIVISWYSFVFNSFIYKLYVRDINIAWIVTNHFSTWLVACLSIFYFLKIANFSNFLFLHLKCRAERLVLLILLGTLIILGFQLAFVRSEESAQKNDCEGNRTLKSKSCEFEYFSDLATFTIAILSPFIISSISLLLFIFSLWKHLKKMKLSGKRSQDPCTKVHVTAMHTALSFLLLFTIYFLSLTISGWSSEIQQSRWIITVCRAIGIIYPSTHSVVLILVNQKLTQAFLSVLWKLIYWLKENP
ncbi:taste receptor type 2 member 19-like [Tenrec ecaudatus]|uniref:taste receptor type 2 member 19-like n=1 Tax=Tenrec ecaudatus TaxID=94439 RepID=UPI003F59B5DB